MEELRVVIEELHRANDALYESRAEVEDERRRYRDLFDLAPEAYLVTDLLGVVREANRAALARLNIPTQFLAGKPLFLFLADEDRPAFRAEARKLRDRAGGAEFEFRLKPRRLPTFEASIRVGVVRDPWGQATALRWTFRDVSARKRAEEQIQALNQQLERMVSERSEQLQTALEDNERWLLKAHAAHDDEGPEGRSFRDMVEEVDAILWRADAATGRYTFVSRRAEELLGYPSTSWLADPEFWLEHVHPEDRDFAASTRRKHLREGIDHESEYRVVASDGRTLWFREAVRFLRHQPDGPASLYGLMVNISRRKKVERQLQTAKGELVSRLRDLSYLHELAGRLADARGVSATLDEVLSAAASLRGAEMAMIRLLEPSPKVAAAFGLPDEFARWADESGFADFLDRLDLTTIDDLEREPEGSPWREAGRVGEFRAVAVVPLAWGGSPPLGLLVIASRGATRTGERQADLLRAYAGRAARAIEAARAFEQLERADRSKGDALGGIDALLEGILATPGLGSAGSREAIDHQIRQARRLIEGVRTSTGPIAGPSI